MVTIQQIAERVGVSTCTVSWALRGVGEVGEATRKRVLKVAREMGYQPNSPAAMLAMQRHRSQTAAHRIPVAALGMRAGASLIREGFVAATEKLGLEWVPLERNLEGGDAAAALRNLWHRGVKGIFLLPATCGWDEETLGRLDWSGFSVVKNTRGMPSLSFTTVRLSAFDFMLRTLQQVVAAGHRRIGVILTDSNSEQDDLSRLGAVLAFRERQLPAGGWIEYHSAGQATGNDAGALKEAVKWLRMIKPTAVVVFPFSWYQGLEQAGFRIPDKLSVATPIRYEVEGLPMIAGCHAPDEEIGQRAARRLYDLIQSRETGYAAQISEDVIEPEWAGSETLKELAPAKARLKSQVRAE